MAPNPIAMLEMRFPSFHRVERTIAQYIIDHANDVSTMSVQELAARLDVAESSIIRFSKSLGYTGYSDFKRSLLVSAASPEQPIFTELKETDSMEAVSRKIFQSNIQTLQRTVDQLDFQKVEEAARRIGMAKKIMLIGVGASASIAEDFYVRLMRIGMNAEMYSDSHLMQIKANLLSPEDVVVAVSHTGRTSEILRALTTARAAGAAAIGITGYLGTPMAKAASICLELYTPPQLLISPRVAQVSLIDALYVRIAIRRQDSVLQHVGMMEEVLASLRVK